MTLTKFELEQELMYLTSKTILIDMVNLNLIDSEQYLLIINELLDIYEPLISSLWEGK